MKKLRKYQFASVKAANTAILALGTTTDLEGNEVPSNPHHIIKIGHIVETPAVLDKDGKVVTDAVLSSTYSVDVIWEGNPVAAWDANMIWCPPMGVLVSGGIETRTEWVETCKSLHPEFFPNNKDI